MFRASNGRSLAVQKSLSSKLYRFKVFLISTLFFYYFYNKRELHLIECYCVKYIKYV